MAGRRLDGMHLVHFQNLILFRLFVDNNSNLSCSIPLPDRTIFTLYDYRKRIATYRTDLDLLLSHQTFPWIPVWDDHEVADNTYRDGSSGKCISESEHFLLASDLDVNRKVCLKTEMASSPGYAPKHCLASRSRFTEISC